MPQILRQEASLLLPVGACASLHCPAVMPEGSVAQLDSARVAVHSTGCNRHREVAAELGAEALVYTTACQSCATFRTMLALDAPEFHKASLSQLPSVHHVESLLLSLPVSLSSLELGRRALALVDNPEGRDLTVDAVVDPE